MKTVCKLFYTIPLISNDTIKNIKIWPPLWKKKIRQKMQFSQTITKHMGKLSNSLQVRKSQQISNKISFSQTSKFFQTRVLSIIMVWIKQISMTKFTRMFWVVFHNERKKIIKIKISNNSQWTLIPHQTLF